MPVAKRTTRKTASASRTRTAAKRVVGSRAKPLARTVSRVSTRAKKAPVKKTTAATKTVAKRAVAKKTTRPQACRRQDRGEEDDRA